MEKRILLLESRDLCYESNRYFMGCLEDALERAGQPVEICDLSLHMEEKLEAVLLHREDYLAAIDFNSLLPRMELEDGTPYLEAFHVPFLNYLVDHPLYHHAGIRRSFPNYGVICIDTCHKAYVEQYYPYISPVFYLPLGATRTDRERSWEQKRFPLLFMGTYEPEEPLYEQLEEYTPEHREEVATLMEMMEADPQLTQEGALESYCRQRGEEISDKMEFARRLNRDYLADKYLRNRRRRLAVEGAAEAGIPFTIMGHGWETVRALEKSHVTLRPAVGFSASVQMIADAKLLLNTTPGFCGGLHDRVYTAMINGTVCLTENSRFASQELEDGVNAVLYDAKHPGALGEMLQDLWEDQKKLQSISMQASQKAAVSYSWDARARELQRLLKNWVE